MKVLRILLQILLPLLLIAGAAVLAKVVVDRQQKPTVAPAPFAEPLVRVAIATAGDVRLDVAAQGTVEPFRATELAAEVRGRVVAISPNLKAGGFFAAGEELVTVDRADYELAVAEQEAVIARAELKVAQEKAEAEAAQRAWRELEGDRAAGPLVTREAQVREAEAALAAAKAQLGRARLDLARTSLRAPYAGRVRSAAVDIGQFVQPGQALARIHGTDAAEVRLPVPAADVAFAELPLHADAGVAETPVDLAVDFGGVTHTYRGVVVRTEGEIDRKTRQLTVVARVDQPYARGPEGDRPPLVIGTFANATIHGRLFRGVIEIPREGLRADGSVWIVDAENRLRRRDVSVLRVESERVLVRDGLAAGDRVCLTAVDAATDGSPVRLQQKEQR